MTSLSRAKLSLSVVVPTYNRRASLARMLDALRVQTVPCDQFEVVVVDDGSTDGTVEMLRAASTGGLQIRVVGQPHKGPAAARNLGVEQARSELILFLDDDVVPQPDLLEQHLAVHLAHDNYVVIGPMRPPVNWKRAAWVRWEEELLQAQYDDLAAGKYPCTPRQFYTANASLHRYAFLAAGGFDSVFKRAEDVELAYRMRDNGAEFVFLPDAGVMHYASRTFAAWARTPYQYGRYDVVMHHKGHEALWCASNEFVHRNPLNRVLARACVGRKPLASAVVWALRATVLLAEALGAHHAAVLALSGIYNTLYWQGAADELGGASALWNLMAQWRRIDATAATAVAP